MNTEYANEAKVFKALCDEKRLAILELLRSGEKCACVLMEQMGIGQSSLSYHMKILCESGIIQCRHEGKWSHYSISQLGSKYAIDLLTKITTPYEIQKPHCCAK